MKLYYAPGACSLSPHICLREAGAAFTLERVDTATHRTETGVDYYSVNPKGYVPALRLDDGDLLTEGVAIVQFIADQHPESGLAPANGTRARVRLQELLNYLSSELHKAFVPLFTPSSTAEAKEAARAKVGARLDFLEGALADGRPHLLGDAFSAADAYFFVMTTWTGPTGVDLKRWPKLSALAARLAERPAVQAALRAEGLAA